MDSTEKHSIIFIHGQESSSRGTKGLFFKKHFPEMIIPDFTGDVSSRMIKLEEILSGKKGIIMVGSSLGGLMAALYGLQNEDRVDTLILLAPALSLPEFDPFRSRKFSAPVCVFHGRDDELLPVGQIREIAKTVFPNLTFTVLDDDHRLSRTFTSIDWPGLLESKR
jgi:predicted esterase